MIGAIPSERFSFQRFACASNVSATRPTISTGDHNSERAKKRIFFRYPEKSTTILKSWDLEVRKAAAIGISGRMLLQIDPDETRQKLLALAARELGNKRLESVHKTTFGVRAI